MLRGAEGAVVTSTRGCLPIDESRRHISIDIMVKPCHYDEHGTLGILTIDDDQVNIMVMESLLGPLGFRVMTAQDGSEAYAWLNDEDTWPDIVFLDYNLEFGDSGETVLLKLRQMFGPVPIPIVMCTAMSAGPAVTRCLQNGASGVLLKPYERAKVLEVIQRQCGAKGIVPSATPPTASNHILAPEPAAAQPVQPPSPSPASTAPSVQQFCDGLGLEYVGQKLAQSVTSLDILRAMDDTALRKAGVVVKGQRDKLMAALQAL